MADKYWMNKAFANAHGQLHEDLGVPKGQKIPAKKLSKAMHRGGIVGKRALLAANARKANA